MSISFCGNFKINVDKCGWEKSEDAGQFANRITKENAECYPTFSGTTMYQIIVVDDNFDKQMETYLKNMGISYTHKSLAELVSEKSIRERLRIPEYRKNSFVGELVEVKTDIFDKIFQNSFQYLGKYPDMRNPERYDGFIKYLKENKSIDAPEVYIRENNGKPEISFQDGTHRYAVMRDMGFKTIPVAMDKESYENAIRFGII